MVFVWVLAAMGHGDDLAIVDGNHPAERIARATTSGRLVRLPGVAIDRAMAAILRKAEDGCPVPASSAHSTGVANLPRKYEMFIHRTKRHKDIPV